MPGLSGLLKGTLAVLRRRLGVRPAGGAWWAGVQRVAEELESLNRSTERDFLAVGEKLMEFRSTARRIASDLTALTELISGEQGRAVSHALNRTLQRSREMDAQIGLGGQALECVGGLSSRVRLAFAGLGNTAPAFRTLCTLTRIETSRLGGGAGFGDLAAEVGPLSESIQSSGEGILEASGRLDRGVRSAVRRGADLRARHLKELPAVIAGVIEGLQSFDERRGRAVETSARQAVQYEALCSAVDGVVESVQFHDITRQQIEHVAQALRHLGPEHQAGLGSRNSLPSGARAILALQSSQLSGAAGVFAASVERMDRDLASIAGRVLEMAEASRALMGISADDQDSFFLRMEGHLTGILKMLGICEETQTEMKRTAAALEETAAGMRESVAEIREIEIRIQRIALNAMIRATHLGDAGNALNAIAEVMQGLARDSHARTGDADAALDAMIGSAGCVSRGSNGGPRDGAAAGASEAIGEMRRTVLELHSSSERSFSRLNRIAALGAQLAGEIALVRAGFSAGGLFAQVVEGARAELERIVDQAALGPSDSGASVPAPQLESLARRYTMQTERDVHQSAAGSAPGAASTVSPRAPTEDGWLGDNVELF